MDDYEIQSIASRELQGGEQLIWWGQPTPEAFVKQGIPFMLFGIPWTLFSLFWMAMAIFITDEAGVFKYVFALFGLPFVLIGFWMLASPILRGRKALQTVYAITTQRALIITTGQTRHVVSFLPTDIRRIETVEKQDGSGDCIFITEGDKHDSRKVGFFGIPQVRTVEMMLRDHLLRPGSSQ